jgi:hypothetical protein
MTIVNGDDTVINLVLGNFTFLVSPSPSWFTSPIQPLIQSDRAHGTTIDASSPMLALPWVGLHKANPHTLALTSDDIERVRTQAYNLGPPTTTL